MDVIATTLPFPLVPEGVTASWLTAALRQKGPTLTVISTEIMDVLTGTSTKIRVRLTCEGPESQDMPAALIVKGVRRAQPLLP